ncbi:carboxymuconolactone decarboxylase family protein [Blastococcus sp. SYSU D00695]
MDPAADASPGGFLAPAPPSPGAARLAAEDREQLGFVMNLTAAWSHLPDEHDALADLLARAATAAGLDRRGRGVLVAAVAGVLGDPHCGLAWGDRLAEEVGEAAAAGVLTGDDGGLDARDAALASWARQLARDPNGTTAADVQRLRDAGFDDRQVVALTLYAALRLAFSTVNDALGASPDRQLQDMVPAAVRAAVDARLPRGGGPAAGAVSPTGRARP